jgi:hypothetical protein
MIQLKALLKESSHAAQLAVLIDDAIEQVDADLDIKHFATAVASIMQTNYGDHLYKQFLQQLTTMLQQDAAAVQRDRIQ